MGSARPLRADARRNRERILEAAREAFAAEGVSVSLDEIARRAGVGPGTVHRHFPTKKELYEAIVAAHLDELREETERALNSDTGGADFFAFLTGLVARAHNKQDLTEAFAAAGVEPGPEAQRAAGELRQVFAALLRKAQQAGVVRDDVDADDVQAVVVAALAAQRYRNEDQRIADLVLNCLRP
ncbi:TetR/AcrR family transcriptional regulator [Actinomadura napierensis]|uniref:TetR/AcrR family transcriptional regulator n=1 Tax=Actinomadura napierensis TaxID=267854 RepID=A0ABN2Y4G4_9ACTN